MNQNGEIKCQEYIHIGRVTDFRYCVKIKNTVGALWDLRNIYDPGWGMLASEDTFVFVDNHDNQRGHGAGGDVLNFKKPREYKMAQAMTLAYNFGHPRVMSSYYFDNTDEGPPHDENYNTLDVTINADGSCGNGWVCEHRWQAIAGLVGFRKAVEGTPVENWWESGNQIAFSRGNKGFFAITNLGGLNERIYTGLPAGQYCNVAQGCATPNGCAGDTVTVDGNGYAQIVITNSQEPIFAIHVEATPGSGGCISGETIPTNPPAGSTTPAAATPSQSPTLPQSTTPAGSPPPSNFQRTVIFIKAVTQPGQDLFIRGGIGHDERPGCVEGASTSACAIDISHNSLGTDPHYDKHNAWRGGDTKLDWYGAETGQGSYQGMKAEGTPAAWTTNVVGGNGYQELNRWGQHYWMTDVEVDCSQTESGWFELKTYITNVGWEYDITQSACTGTVGGAAPYQSTNHMALCGHLNVFTFHASDCIIDSL